MLAVALTVGYLITFMAVAQLARTRVGSANMGGSPQWRNALGLLPQLIVLPTLLLASLHPPWTLTAQQVFINVFAGLLVFDFAVLKLNLLMVLHHGTCLLGHAYAIKLAPEAFPCYFAAVAALEAGSGCSCAWWLWGDQQPQFCTAAYKAGMTLSNMLATAGLLAWSKNASSLPLAGRVGPILITAALIYFRQAEMDALLKYGRGACKTG